MQNPKAIQNPVLSEQEQAEFAARQQKFLRLNQDAFGQLVTFADFAAEKLTLGFVAVNFARDQALLLDALEQDSRCADIQFERFQFDDPELRFLRDALLEELPKRERQSGKKLILVVTGLEQSIGLVGDYPLVLQDLNYVRDAFSGSVPHPILVLLPDGALSRLARFAPDFWAWRLGVFEFKSLPETAADAEQLSLRSERIRGSLELEERQNKVDLLLRLLTQYKADEATEEDLKTQIQILNELGLEYKTLGKVEDSERCLQQALRLNPSTENFAKSKSASLERLAQIQNIQGQLDKALQLFQSSLELYEQLNDDRGKAFILHEMAVIYSSQGQVDDAIALYEQSIEIEEQIGNVQGKAATLHQMAGIYANQGKVEQAIALYEQSLELKEQIGDVQGKAATLVMMGQLLAKQGQLDRAIAMTQNSLMLLQQIGSWEAPKVERMLDRLMQMQ